MDGSFKTFRLFFDFSLNSQALRSISGGEISVEHFSINRCEPVQIGHGHAFVDLVHGLPTRPNSTTGQSFTMKRASDVPPVVESFGSRRSRPRWPRR